MTQTSTTLIARYQPRHRSGFTNPRNRRGVRWRPLLRSWRSSRLRGCRNRTRDRSRATLAPDLRGLAQSRQLASRALPPVAMCGEVPALELHHAAVRVVPDDALEI